MCTELLWWCGHRRAKTIGKFNRYQRHQPIVTFLTFLFILFLPTCAVATVSYEDKLDRFLQQMMTDGAIPGMAIAIVKDGKVSLSKGYGVTGDGQPFTQDTPVLIASLSKAMTAAVALMLVAEGLIDLDTPVQRYVPTFRVNSPDGGRAITIRHLLNQTSGLSDPGFPEMRMAQPKTLVERVTSLQFAIPEDSPGTAFHYFNSNYALVARIVEVVSSKPFEVVLKDKLFKPLGMTGTNAVPTFALAQALAAPPAAGHVVAYGQAWRWHEFGGFMRSWRCHLNRHRYGSMAQVANDGAASHPATGTAVPDANPTRADKLCNGLVSADDERTDHDLA